MGQAGSVSPAEELSGGAPQQKEFRPDIEGLRAVAVIAVVLFHAAVPRFGGGYVGVDVFFVISGFLITGLLWREAHSSGTVRLRAFYGARARRLLPASAAVGVITMIASALFLPPLQVSSVLKDGIASALYVSNYWFIAQNSDYFADLSTPSPFLHYWSLGVEEQFYLVWPALILATAWLIRRVRRRTRTEATSSRRPYLVALAVAAVLSFALSIVATYVSPDEAFFSLPTRSWQLALGGLVALTAGQWRRLGSSAATITGWTGLALILLACTWLTADTLYPGIAALVPTVGAALVIGAGCAGPSQGCGRVLGVWPIQRIGRISYSWYLWHWPILILVPLIVGHPLGLPARLAAALASCGLAVITQRVLEDPLRFSPKIRDFPWRSLGLGGVATAIAVTVGITLLKVVPTPVPVGRGVPAAPLVITAAPVPAGSESGAYDAAVRRAFGQVQAALGASADLRAVPANLTPSLTAAAADRGAMSFDGCMRTGSEAGQPECATGDTASATTVALVGDSHAAMWNPAFLQLADQRHWRLETLAKAACPLQDVPMANHLRRVVEHFQNCERWRGQIIARLQADRPRLVVVSMLRDGERHNNRHLGFTTYDRVWLDALTRLVHQLRANGAQVLVLGPVPNPQSVVPMCLSVNLDDAAACASKRSTAVNESGIAAEAAATEAADGQYADLTDLFCTTDRCPAIVGNTLVYFDSNHLTLDYSRALAPIMGALADRALAHS